jgi:hypothetical protein
MATVLELKIEWYQNICANLERLSLMARGPYVKFDNVVLKYLVLLAFYH